ncbi:M28 family peptidase [soil metagenome]
MRQVYIAMLATLYVGCADSPDDKSKPRDQFGQDRVKGATPEAPVKTPFDGDRAMKYLKELCEIGTRVSGSEGMAKQQELLVKHFEKYGAKVTKQPFEAKQKSRAKAIGMTNLICQWHPERDRRIILCAHYDTRPKADEDNPENWSKPFLSANDGTSGVAFLMEVAHHLKDLPTKIGVDIILFDGEEYIFERGRFYGDGDDFFFGSEHFARDYDKNRKKLPYTYEAAVLFDLFAAKDARLAVEGYSYSLAPKLVDELWKTAEKVGAKSFKYERGFRRNPEVMDDHIALNRVAIPAVDIIDFDYADWHKISDTPDKCSEKQMTEVGSVILTWLQGRK